MPIIIAVFNSKRKTGIRNNNANMNTTVFFNIFINGSFVKIQQFSYQKNNDDLNIEVQAYTSTIIDNSNTESERKYFIESDIKYSLTRNFALALNYNWSCEVQLGKISLVGFL